MRWIWLDKILTLEKAKHCVAIRNVTSAEDLLHDHFEATEHHGLIGMMPNSLIIEGMAQTAGVLVGHANDFKHKVILAKINKAEFDPAVHARPGTTLRHTATLERLDDTGGQTRGVVDLIDSATGQARPLGTVDLMFSHIENNRQGLEFPEHNFVFSSLLKELLDYSGY